MASLWPVLTCMPGPAEEGPLPLKRLKGKVMPGTVVLNELLGLVEDHTQCVPKLGVGNPVLPVKLDKVQLACLPVEIHPVRADLLLEVLWQVEADGHKLSFFALELFSAPSLYPRFPARVPRSQPPRIDCPLSVPARQGLMTGTTSVFIFSSMPPSFDAGNLRKTSSAPCSDRQYYGRRQPVLSSIVKTQRRG